jgi:choline dehydrogenase-like flavoprotein
LAAAANTGKMTLRPDSIVHSIIYDEKKGRAKGVRVIDANTKETTEYYAKVIFINAGTLNSALIMLNSNDTARFSKGLGNDSDTLGRYLMDHNYRGRAYASFDGLQDVYYKGRRPVGFIIPRFRNFGADKQSSFTRGYAVIGEAGRGDWSRGTYQDGFGADFKTAMTKPGPWQIGVVAMAEMLPHADNRVSLNTNIRDKWGMPTLDIDCQFRENEEAMLKDVFTSISEMFEKAGLKDIHTYDSGESPGRGIHEMGTARMGRDPKTSMLNGFNQMHAIKNVFVTDGSSMASTAWQNPSVTYMALTARAVDYCVKEMKKGNI